MFVYWCIGVLVDWGRALRSALRIGIGHWAFCAPAAHFRRLKRIVAKQRTPKLLTTNFSLLSKKIQFLVTSYSLLIFKLFLISHFSFLIKKIRFLTPHSSLLTQWSVR